MERQSGVAGWSGRVEWQSEWQEWSGVEWIRIGMEWSGVERSG